MSGADDFTTTIPMEVLPQLLALGRHYGFDPLSSVEMESYFTSLLREYTILDLERSIIPNAFVSLETKPSWLQSSEWPLSDGQPMIFLSQLDVPTNPYILGETTVYIFCDRNSGAIQTVVQRVGYVP